MGNAHKGAAGQGTHMDRTTAIDALHQQALGDPIPLAKPIETEPGQRIVVYGRHSLTSVSLWTD